LSVAKMTIDIVGGRLKGLTEEISQTHGRLMSADNVVTLDTPAYMSGDKHYVKIATDNVG